MSDITFRKATLDDLDGIIKVELDSFTLPWSREAFYNEFVNNQFAHYFVLEHNESIIGYCGVWIVIDEAHITNIAISPKYRGLKLGTTLMKKIMEFARLHRAHSMTLEVRVSNYVAQSLYRKLGFQNGGIRKGYYTDNYEDALVMWVKL
ncbi:ribosomal protein S18-alanine N-acetyltransferase [Bacillus sp. FJAT-49736]|uniref:ribosomal protein S18-alanine N-acetyltransferase n=1 Tax=Bacillus sp. FJAT-49736 TaxID=2833582 RepID=UPI001BCA35BD|nr:ribosomal protein S18-alanine N-acetyltransferase [Bacillus sp. FJAT-49736]MBS4175833.1 ribosomal protein S18-alanine N-acetyltransferase [Bacillus sp. FJAT-49736]